MRTRDPHLLRTRAKVNVAKSCPLYAALASRNRVHERLGYCCPSLGAGGAFCLVTSCLSRRSFRKDASSIT